MCRMTQAYSLRLPFTNVIIAATFAISMISISILSLITTYTYVFHTSRYNTRYYFFKKLRSILAAVQSPKLVLVFCEK